MGVASVERRGRSPEGGAWVGGAVDVGGAGCHVLEVEPAPGGNPRAGDCGNRSSVCWDYTRQRWFVMPDYTTYRYYVADATKPGVHFPFMRGDLRRPI